MLEVASLALPLFDPVLAQHTHLSIFLLLPRHSLTANSVRVLPVLLLTCEDPLHAVLKDPLFLSIHIPLLEVVDICSMVDIVPEILTGVDFVIRFELGLIFIDARVDTWTGVLAVHHEKLLFLAEVPPDEAERMLELIGPVALKDDQQFGVKWLCKHLSLDEGHDLFTWAVVFDRGVDLHHLDVVEAFQLHKRVGRVVIDNKVSHALNRDSSFLLNLDRFLQAPLSFFHNQANALLPQSEEGEAHDEVDGLYEAVVGQEILVRALREEYLNRVTISSLQN
jgi:hypothetical protein